MACILLIFVIAFILKRRGRLKVPKLFRKKHKNQELDTQFDENEGDPFSNRRNVHMIVRGDEVIRNPHYKEEDV